MLGRADTNSTMIQSAIVVVVCAVVVGTMFTVMRGREYKRAQALVFSQPWDVLELRARPAKEEFTWDEDIVISCYLANKTDYALSLPELFTASLTFDDHVVATGGGLIDHQHLLKPRQTLSREIRLKTEYTGLPRPKHGPAGLARVVFHGSRHKTDTIPSESGAYSHSIVSGAPVLRSEEFDLSILVERE